MKLGKRTKIFAALTAAVKPLCLIINYYVGQDIIPEPVQGAFIALFGAAGLYFLADKGERIEGKLNGGSK